MPIIGRARHLLVPMRYGEKTACGRPASVGLTTRDRRKANCVVCLRAKPSAHEEES